METRTISLPDITPEQWFYLAGFLEGEGSFLKGPPSAPGICRITFSTTDEDVATVVAELLGSNVNGPYMAKKSTKPYFVVASKGCKAWWQMHYIRPLMGVRRQKEIDDALKDGSPFPNAKKRKLSDSDVTEIRKLVLEYSVSQRVVAKQFDVDFRHISAICKGKDRSWEYVEPLSALDLSVYMNRLPYEHYWLAGILEGEGSFRAPTLKKPGRLNVSVAMTDNDTINRAALLLQASSVRSRKAEKDHWKNQWVCQISGVKAYRTLSRLYPLFGLRRSSHIQECLRTFLSSPGTSDDGSRYTRSEI